MTKKLVIIKIVFLLFIQILGINYHVNGQDNFIIAGLHDSTDSFCDVMPDSTFSGGYYSPFNYYIDINNDSVNDLKFTSSYQSNAGGFYGQGGVSITILNGELLKDSIRSDFAAILSYSDTITNDINWIGNTTLKISYYLFTQCPPMCPGSNTQINVDEKDKYLGYRINSLNDTLYGWIKFSVNSIRMTIIEWNLKKPLYDALEDKGFDITIHIFPNPTNDVVTIESSNNAFIELSNINGQVIKTINTSEKENSFDLNGLKEGVYIVKVKTEKGFAVKKILKI